MDPVIKKRILEMIERQGTIKSDALGTFIKSEIPDNEITLDKARNAVATGYANAIKRTMDGIGRPLVRSVRRDDGWWVVSAARYGPTEAELNREYHVGRRDSAEKAIAFNARLAETLTRSDCTLSEIPAEVWEQLVVTG